MPATWPLSGRPTCSGKLAAAGLPPSAPFLRLGLKSAPHLPPRAHPPNFCSLIHFIQHIFLKDSLGASSCSQHRDPVMSRILCCQAHIFMGEMDNELSTRKIESMV